HIDMMTGLVGEHAAIIGPSAAPIVLIVIGLVPAPAHAHCPKNETAESTGLQRLACLNPRNVEAILLDDKKLDAGFVTGADHVVRILEPQRHRLFNNHMFSCPCAGDDMLGEHSAWRQDNNRVDLFSSQKVIAVVVWWHPKIRRDRVSALANGVADSGEAGPIDVIATEQIGVKLRDASTTEQAEFDHRGSFFGAAACLREGAHKAWRVHGHGGVYIRKSPYESSLFGRLFRRIANPEQVFYGPQMAHKINFQ